MNLHYSSLLEVSDLMRAKQLSPVELTREMLDRIGRLNPSLGAYYTIFADQALAEASSAESEIAGGRWRGPLHGVPIAFKDLYELGPTTAGSKPTFGLLSTKGLIPLSPSLDHAGPMARTVADAAALGSVPFDSDGGLRGLRVGVPRDFWTAGDPQVRERVEASIKSLAGAGAAVEDVSLGFSVVQVMATGYLITMSEA